MLLLTFRVAQDLYAVDANRVVEVVPRVEPRPIPRTPAFLAGVFGYRGRVVPAIELGRLLDKGVAPGRLSTRVIVVSARKKSTDGGGSGIDEARDEDEGLLLGLIAEQVHDVMRVDQNQVVFPSLRLDDAPYLGAMIQVDPQTRSLAQLIEVDSVLPPTLRDALFGGWEKTDEHDGAPNPGGRSLSGLTTGSVEVEPRPEADLGVAAR